MNKTLLSKGCLLIAEPSILGDTSFTRSVVLLTEHSNSGSVGFILNKPLSYTLQDAISDIDASFSIYNGGPVEQDNLYFIHNTPQLITDSVEISDGIYWGGNFDVVKHLINSKKINHHNIRFFLGYSGWDTNQLELELEENAWIVTKNNFKSKLLLQSNQQLWKDKIEEQGGEYILFSNAPDNPMLN